MEDAPLSLRMTLTSPPRGYEAGPGFRHALGEGEHLVSTQERLPRIGLVAGQNTLLTLSANGDR